MSSRDGCCEHKEKNDIKIDIQNVKGPQSVYNLYNLKFKS